MDAAYVFSGLMTSYTSDQLPADVVELTRRQILDMTGVTLGGSSRPGIQELAELTTHWGGKTESSLICFGAKVPAPAAAQVNASMGHALDYDDTGAGPTHPSVVIVPTCLAVAEQQGGCSGRDFIAAVALGTDMMCRMGQAFRSGQKGLAVGGHPGAGWHLTTLYGYIAAAAVSARLMGLDKKQSLNAMGIAYHQCSGNGQCVTEGALTKRMGPGFAARGGITAAFMAQKGITGAEQCLEGEVGLFNLYHRGEYDPVPLTHNLGTDFLGRTVSMKSYPCCKGTHGFTNAALDLVRTENIDPSQIREIAIYCSDATSVLISPREKRCRPKTPVDAQFSIPWAISSILAHKKVGLADFFEAAINDPELLGLTEKVRVIEDPEIPGTTEMPGGRITVTMADGAAFTMETREGAGPEEQPLPLDIYISKFRDCVSHAARPVSDQRINTLIDHIRDLEQLDNIQTLIDLLNL